jgi:GT2 family glycosyltransferase
LRRAVVDEVGPLDEQLAVGTFEDDYTMRVRRAGNRVVCAEDAVVHHIGRASLVDDEHYARIFDENRAKFEAKWQQAWVPHRARLSGGMRTVQGNLICGTP